MQLLQKFFHWPASSEKLAAQNDLARGVASLSIDQGSSSHGRSLHETLPVELLEAILLCVEDAQDASDLRLLRSGSPKRLKSFATRMRLVCRLWRTIVDEQDRFSETILWLEFECPHFEYIATRYTYLERSIAVFKEDLGESGTSDLVVAIRTKVHFAEERPSRAELLIAEQLKLLIPHCDRLRRISMWMDTIYLGCYLAEVMGQFEGVARLDSVHIEGDQYGRPLPGNTKLDFSRCINLSSLTINRANILSSIKLPPSLMTLILRGPCAPKEWTLTRSRLCIEWSNLKLLLLSCPQISAITFAQTWPTTPDHHELPRIHLPNLQELKLDNDTRTNASITRSLDTPNLRRLHLQFEQDGTRLVSMHNPISIGSIFPQFHSLQYLCLGIRVWSHLIETLLMYSIPQSLRQLTLRFHGISNQVPADIVRWPTFPLRTEHLCIEYWSGTFTSDWPIVWARMDYASVRQLTVRLGPPQSLPPPAPTAIPIFDFPSLVELCLINFGSTAADVLCQHLNAPMSTKLTHESNYLLEKTHSQGPFPRPWTWTSAPGPPWYESLITLDITTSLVARGAENVLCMFPKAETLSLTIPIFMMLTRLEEKFLEPISRKRSTVMPKLQRLELVLRHKPGFDIVGSQAGSKCRTILEKAVRHRAIEGRPLKNVDIYCESYRYIPGSIYQAERSRSLFWKHTTPGNSSL